MKTGWMLLSVPLTFFDGWIGFVGWILAAAFLAVILLQRKWIKRLDREVREERGERVKLEAQVEELKTRVKKQQDDLTRGALERLDLSRKIEGLQKELTTNRNHLVELAKSNEFLRTTLDEVLKRVKALEGK